MTNLLYDILLHITIIITAPYFVFKMLTAHKYRDGILERFGVYQPDKLKPFRDGRTVWFHAISVGETKAAVPVLKLFRQRHPQARILFSTVTQTGRKTAELECKGLIDGLVYFPLDLSWVVSGLIRRIRPAVFVTVEKDIWPNTFTRLHAAGVPVIVINGTLSDKSARRFKRFSFFLKDVFGAVSAFCARTSEDAEKAVSVGVSRGSVHTTGNIKFDLQPSTVDGTTAAGLARALGIRSGDLVFTAGSTHGNEEDVILRVFKRLVLRRSGLKLILAPRHPERFDEVEAIVRKTGLSYGRRTKGTVGDVVILDTVGELMTVWSFSDVALVAGSLVPGIGGHNLLEPAFFAKPVVYGPHLTAYLSMAELLEAAGGGVRVADEAGLFDAVDKLLSDGGLRVKTGGAARSVVEANRGAAEKSVEIIERFMPSV